MPGFRRLGLPQGRALCAAVAIAALLAGGARADEPAGADLALPEYETTALEAEAAAEEVPPAVLPVDGVTVYPADDDVDPAERPEGVEGAFAIAGDLLVMRPLGFASLFAGGLSFLLSSPVALPIGALDENVDALGTRAEDVFRRPLGEL